MGSAFSVSLPRSLVISSAQSQARSQAGAQTGASARAQAGSMSRSMTDLFGGTGSGIGGGGVGTPIPMIGMGGSGVAGFEGVGFKGSKGFREHSPTWTASEMGASLFTGRLFPSRPVQVRPQARAPARMMGISIAGRKPAAAARPRAAPRQQMSLASITGVHLGSKKKGRR
jgi:hypothetical protein